MSSPLGPTPIERPRFTVETPWDHQPGLWISTILSIAYAGLTLGVRHIIRKKFVAPDIALVVSYVLALCSYILMFVALHNGAGESPDHLSQSEYAHGSKLVFASIIFTILTFGGTSCSQLFLLEELMPGKLEKRACWLSVAICSLLSVASCLAVSAGCNASEILNAGSSNGCSAPIARWSVAITFELINSLIPSLMPIFLFRNLQAEFRRKLGIYFAFGFAILNVPVAAVALDQYNSFIHHGRDGMGIVPFLCCLEVLLFWSLVAPTIPIGRPMALRFTTHGTVVLGGPESSIKSFRRTSAVSTGRSKGRVKLPCDDEIELRPDKFMHSSSIGHESKENVEKLRNSSSIGSGIRKTVETEVATMDAIEFINHHQHQA